MSKTTPIIDKALVTNLVALLILTAGFFSPYLQQQLFSIGIFALSGAITNWLAVYMLFEKIPLLYGSGVIPNRFEAFRDAIKNLVMAQFFNSQQISQVLKEEEDQLLNWFKVDRLVDAVDYDFLFQKLVDAIMESSFGSMLSMLGGASALEKLKEPFKQKLAYALAEIVQRDSFKEALLNNIDNQQLADDLLLRIEKIIDTRLAELTPQIVKSMVQQLIKEHLGWLVVWGGVFGGLIGLVASFIKY
ncbi:MAG: DUF445 domain-containing protein [Gammaproteobacteria bacterium]|nr:DUF445 domain-containing protein [Gammaproteobacteria bacterium]MDH5729923.1 DUF445 domain-containing protein [Gammaproteobacteria bacterium]